MALSGSAFVTEVEALAKQAGDKYFYGGTSPSTGFDCSGLIYDALIKLGYKSPPRTSEAQWAWIQQNNATVTKAQLQPGDLVFAQFAGDNASPGHVGIYIGNGNVFSAQDPQLGIGISTLASWGNNIVGYGRVPGSAASTGQASDTGATTDSANPIGWVIGSSGAEFKWFGGLIRGVTGQAATIGDVATGVTGIVRSLTKLTDLFLLLFRPEFWLRVGAFIFGVIALGAGLYFFKEAL